MNYLRKLWSEERFSIPAKIVLSYVLWKIFHHFAKQQGTVLGNFWERFVFKIGTVYAWFTSITLIPFVDATHSEGISIYFNKGHDYRLIWVQDHCLAIPAMVVFTATVVFFRGPARDKAWFIPLGLFGIILINLLRLFGVCLAWLYATPYFFEIDHSIIYVGLCYGFIFLMLVWWIRRTKKKSNDETVSAL
ncbi:MAG: Exosortase EpsH-related protein [Bacteroidetes bacterium]|nr:Exosortase EpsH-related protein [Bacteroidota bacterium]